MWRTVTSKDVSLTGILMPVTYKEKTYKANIILKDFTKELDFGLRFFFRFCMGYCILTYCFVAAFET